MWQPEDVEYTVLLVSATFGEPRENAEQVIEEALNWLNTFREEPGFRFAPNVTAHLEIVPDVEEARARLEGDESLAMMILHDLDDEERLALTHDCRQRDVAVCRTVPAADHPEPPRRNRNQPMKVVIRKREEGEEPPAHTILDTTLTAPLEDEEEAGDRIGQLIAVMALGVMEHHWKEQPPRRFDPLPPGSDENT
jgi:hypothetical protein